MKQAKKKMRLACLAPQGTKRGSGAAEEKESFASRHSKSWKTRKKKVRECLSLSFTFSFSKSSSRSTNEKRPILWFSAYPAFSPLFLHRGKSTHRTQWTNRSDSGHQKKKMRVEIVEKQLISSFFPIRRNTRSTHGESNTVETAPNNNTVTINDSLSHHLSPSPLFSQ